MGRLRGRSNLAISAAALAAIMLLTTPGWAGDGEAPDSVHSEFDRLIERELDRLFDRLQGALEELPRYALPEITEEGDIIIRRLPRNPRGRQPGPGDADDLVDL